MRLIRRSLSIVLLIRSIATISKGMVSALDPHASTPPPPNDAGLCRPWQTSSKSLVVRVIPQMPSYYNPYPLELVHRGHFESRIALVLDTRVGTRYSQLIPKSHPHIYDILLPNVLCNPLSFEYHILFLQRRRALVAFSSAFRKSYLPLSPFRHNYSQA